MQYLRRLSGLCLLLILLVSAMACTTSEQEIKYSIRPGEFEGQPSLVVSLLCSPDPDGRTEILFPNEAWGQENLFDALKAPSILEEEGELELRVVRDSGWIEILHPRSESLREIRVEYHIVQDIPFGTSAGDPTYRPIVQRSYFHVFGHNLLAMPRHLAATPETPLDVGLRWEGWAPDQVIHNSFGSQELDQRIEGISVARFQSSIFVGGDFRVHETSIQGNRLLLATRGNWIPFTDEQVFEMLKQTVSAQRDFWGDHGQEYFTVTLRPFQQERGSSYQGTGLTHSFAASMSNNSNAEFGQLVHLFNHELMHNWIGTTIQNESEEEQYWFSEGFTEYYTIKNIADRGIAGHGWAYYIEQVNEKIRLLESLSVREAPNSEITYENFWRDREYSDLPYHRGFLYAFYLDHWIYKETAGKRNLDDLMLALLRRATENGQKLNHPIFLETLHDIAGKNPEPFFQRHIVEGQVMPLAELFQSLELEYIAGSSRVFELGFRLDQEQHLATGVNPNSRAFAAGLREGDYLRSHSIYLGNTEELVELKVEREGVITPLTYYPIRMADIPQMTLSEGNVSFFQK